MTARNEIAIKVLDNKCTLIIAAVSSPYVSQGNHFLYVLSTWLEVSIPIASISMLQSQQYEKSWNNPAESSPSPYRVISMQFSTGFHAKYVCIEGGSEPTGMIAPETHNKSRWNICNGHRRKGK